MSRLLIVVASLLATLALPARAQPSARPVILLVHGRGQLGRDSAVVRREGWHALQSSLRAIGSDVALEEQDVRLVWYADILDARSRGAALPSCTADGRVDAAADPTVPSALSLIAAFATVFVEAAAADTGSDERLNLRSVAGDLRYLADADTRCAAESRVGAALRRARQERRPVILVSHSLGALVSWGELTRNGPAADSAPAAVQYWITLGSPLGSAEVRALVFGDERAGVALPKSVRSWANVVGADDPFAARIGGSAPGAALFDVATESPSDEPHQITRYLGDPATGRLVADAWRAARR